MTAGKWDITIEQGADFSLPLRYVSPTNQPIDLTGWSAVMMIRQTVSDPDPLITLSSPSSGITLGGTAGTILIDITAVQTAALPPGIGCYDLKLTDAAGVPQRLIQGTATISEAVTR